MEIQYNTNLKTDYSTLFSSLKTSSSGSSNLTAKVLGVSSDISDLIGDYAQIKNGSYGKLVKAYYKKQAAESKTSTSDTTDTTESTEDTAETTDSVSTTYTSSGTKTADSLSTGSIFDALL